MSVRLKAADGRCFHKAKRRARYSAHLGYCLKTGNGFGNGLPGFTRFGSSKFSGIRCHSGANSPFHAVNSGSTLLVRYNKSDNRIFPLSCWKRSHAVYPFRRAISRVLGLSQFYKILVVIISDLVHFDCVSNGVLSSFFTSAIFVGIFVGMF